MPKILGELVRGGERGILPAVQNIDMFFGLSASNRFTVPDLIGSAILGALLWTALRVGPALLSGDHFRKARPGELRWASALFAFIPIWGALFVYFGDSYMARAGPVGLWLQMMGEMLALGSWLWVWTRFVSAKVSWWFGGFVWAITLWLALTNRLAP